MQLVEFAYYFNELEQVHLIEAQENILPIEDIDVGKELKNNFEKNGIRVLTNTEVLKIESLKTKVKVLTKRNGDEKNYHRYCFINI